MSTGEREIPGGLWQRALRRIDWKANPVLLRDLRLYMRGRVLLAAYFLVLAVLVLSGIVYAVGAHFNDGNGRALLTVPTFLLAVICGAFVPNLVGERFRVELSSRATELALASALPPERLVRGKLLGAWLLSLLCVSVAMPVLATAYMLGGISPYAIVVLGAGVLYAAAVMPTVQLYLATAGRRSGMMRIVDALAFVGNIVAMLLYAPLLLEIVDSGESEMYLVLASLVIASFLIAQFLYKVTISRLRGEAEARELAPRRALTVAAVLGWGSAFGIMALTRAWSMGVRFDYWEMAALASMCAAYPFAWGIYILSHGNAEKPRLASVRGGLLGRWLGTAGPDSLIALYWLGSILLMGVGYAGLFSPFSGSDILNFFCPTLAPLLAVGYGLIAYQFAVRPFQKDTPGFNRLSGVIFVVNLVLAIPGYFLVRLISLSRSDDFEWVNGLFPIGLFTSASRYDAYEMGGAGLIALAIVLLLLTPAVWRAWRAGWRKGNGNA